MSFPPYWERYVSLGSYGTVRLAMEQGAAFRELVLYTRDDRTVLANDHGDYSAENLVNVINDGRAALKRKPEK